MRGNLLTKMRHTTAADDAAAAEFAHSHATTGCYTDFESYAALLDASAAAKQRRGYDLADVRVATALVYGERDTLIDPAAARAGLGAGGALVGALGVPSHGHMDNLCGDTQEVNRHIAELLRAYSLDKRS